MDGSVVIAHPGGQHSCETALAVQEAGLLKRYITGIYYKPNSIFGRTIRLVQPIERQFRRRYKEGLSEPLVTQYPLGETLYLTATKLKPLATHTAEILHWRNRRFDRIVSQVMKHHAPTAFIAYDTCALQAFTVAKSLGSLCILDQSIGHWRTLTQMMREEADIQPDFADSLPLDAPDWLLAQCDEEAHRADMIFCGSDYVKKTMISHGVDPSRIAIIPYGADIERFRPRGRSDNGPFRLLFVGQLTQRKGIKYLLKAVKGLRATGLELLMVGGIIGSGAGLSAYSDYFKHIPNIPHYELHKYFEGADVFVYPSLHEGSAIAIYEALAAGLPVITTPNSGSVVRDGVEGFIVPIRDVEALKEKILLLYKDRELAREMGRRARRRAEEFTWAAYRRNVGALLRGLLENPARVV